MGIAAVFSNNKPSVVVAILIEKIFSKQLRNFDEIDKYFRNKVGIEIGGPSRKFRTGEPIPLYDLAKQVDGCNFSSNTEWEGEIKEGKTYQYHNGKTGYQFICDGVDVPIIPKGTYDFVLSCHNLEHIANPLKAIENWAKLLKSGRPS